MPENINKVLYILLILGQYTKAHDRPWPCIVFTEDSEFFEFKEPSSDKGFYSFVYTMKPYESEQGRRDTIQKYSANPGLWQIRPQFETQYMTSSPPIYIDSLEEANCSKVMDVDEARIGSHGTWVNFVKQQNGKYLLFHRTLSY